MQDLPIIISVAALLISGCSFAAVVFSIRRETGRICAWTSVSLENQTPGRARMHLYVANIGHRPVLIRNLIRTAGKSTWRSLLNAPSIGDGERVTNVSPAPGGLVRKSVAHLSTVKLCEAEVFEVVFEAKDFATFTKAYERDICIAMQLFVDDVTGRRYPVADAEENLEKLGRAWRIHSESTVHDLEVKLGLIRGSGAHSRLWAEAS